MGARTDTAEQRGTGPDASPRILAIELDRDLSEKIVEQLSEPVAILVVSGDGLPAIAYVNPALARLLGRSERALIGQPVQVLAAPASEPLELARLIDAVAQHRPLDLAMQIGGAGGQAVWTEVRGRPLSGAGRRYLIDLRDVTAQRAAVASAQRLEQRFDALTRLSSDSVYQLRVEADCRLALDWTAGGFERLIGYGAPEIEAIGGWSALVDPADARIVQRRGQRLLAGETATAEYRVRGRDGSRRWLRDTGWPQWDDARELVVGALCVAEDITAQRALEERLRVQQSERRALTGLMAGVLCEVDAAGCISAVSGVADGHLPRRLRAAATGSPLQEVIGLDAADLWRRHSQGAVPGWAPVRFTLSHPCGAGLGDEEQYEVSLCSAPAGGALALITPQRLVTGGDRHTHGLADARLRALLELQEAAAVLLAPGAVVVELNEQAERLTGWRRERAIGRRFVELMALDREQPSLLEDLERAQSGNRVSASEAWLQLPDGREGRLVWSYLPLLGGQGEVHGVLARGAALAPRLDALPTVADRRGLRAMMEQVADGILIVDRRGDIVSLSRSAEATLGYRCDQLVGRGVEVVLLASVPDEADVLRRVMELADRQGAFQEVLTRRGDGEVMPVELAADATFLNGEALFVLTIRDIAARDHTEEAIRSLAYRDPLTGLPNRMLFNDRLSQAIERARRNQQPLAVIILDIDRFKLINDSLGLTRGDQVLRAVSQRLVAAVRRSDTVARLGADDFLLLLPGVDGAESTAKVAQKLLDTFVPSLEIDDQELHLGASLGITLYPHDGDDAETLIRNADTALYRAKEYSRGSYQFYTNDMNATAFERLVLETRLRKALERDELILHYQPQVRLDSGAVVAVEALVRWVHGDLGLIPPAEFIPLAEDTGLILELGRWVLRTACTQVRAWQDQGFSDLRLAVNLSGRQFEQDDLVRSIAEVIEEVAFDPADLELELTESSIMRRPEQAVLKLQALARLGIRLSIDDFGTGYSSLGHLKRFPIRTLKIDQSFIQDITTDPNDAAITQAIIALAESLQLKVIAEGVETTDQLNLLRRYHCDEMQGYLFARPLPPGELAELLRSGTRLTH
jgi:diguanylate cyclase (GGDEF)-like protein/PAS domain S-box-containing protein